MNLRLGFPEGEVPAREWMSKRVVGGLNHVLRRAARFKESKPKLAALAAFADAEAVDAAICTGDYTMLGTEVELDAALAAVEPLTRRPLGFTTVAGNHDLYVADAVADKRFEKRFSRWLDDDLPEATRGSGIRVRFFGSEVAVVVIESARPNALWRSSGRVPEAQMAALGSVLARPELAARFTLVITHYAPRLWNGKPDTKLHGLENADELLAILSERENTAFLHGHVHRRYAVRAAGVKPLLLGAGSATDAGREGAWLLELSSRGGTAHPLAWTGAAWARDGAAPSQTL
jgi:3',5'-cyclic AMP phosphodiesterase CpdA